MEEPTVFVVPPHFSLICPIHRGVFNDPVIAPCGCTYCSRCIEEQLQFVSTCPVDISHTVLLTPQSLRPNKEIQERVNELLIHCKYGLLKDPQEGWIPSSEPDSCKMWINLGNRAGHESTCAHKTLEDEFCLIDDDEMEEFQAVSGSPLDSEKSGDESKSESESSSESDDSSDDIDSESDFQEEEEEEIERANLYLSPPVAEESYESEKEISEPELIRENYEEIENIESNFVGIDPPSPDYVVCESDDVTCSSTFSSPRYSPPTHLCPNKFNGCDFSTKSPDALVSHVILCERARMQAQIDDLCVRLQERDDEIRRLKVIVDEASSSSSLKSSNSSNISNNERSIIVAPQDIYVSLAKKGLAKLEEESQRALDEAAAALKRTKAAIKKQSVLALTNIKHVFEEAHDEIVSKFKGFLDSFDRPAPVVRLELPQELEPEDVELTVVIQESEKIYKEESALRENEEELLKQAMRLSLLELQQSGNDSAIKANGDNISRLS